MTIGCAADNLPDEFIDPDPYTVVACWIAAASFALQFVDFVRNLDEQPPAIAQAAGSITPLEKLESSLEEVERHFELLVRTIERGSKDSDGEFFNVEFGIGKASLKLESSRHDAFSTQLAETFAKVSALSLWSNHVIGKLPNAAAILGNSVLAELSVSSERLNNLMRSGARNRELIVECRITIETLRLAVNTMLKSRSN
ncbi:hypothetical protein [Aminobacter sp. MDW-2]|uniref:hypothetical protein n=1 Tax=Aminobacter sp. MDW-2 TaxID=2666139 RepID=UPI0012B0E4F0|nr:hypothetical protein [Aminobacter sp. MDW-2]MRX33205.1 hypothetical protein [Aminobacter sp. MDW-2]QNH36828.1 hypothetical protein H5P29_13540 [Aminobacter sp. MDW-2]